MRTLSQEHPSDVALGVVMGCAVPCVTGLEGEGDVSGALAPVLETDG